MRKLNTKGWISAGFALLLPLCVSCSDEDPDGTSNGATTSSAGEEPDGTSNGATTSSAGGAESSGGSGGAVCPDSLPDDPDIMPPCGSDHAPDQYCGECQHDGLYCDFSDKCGPGSEGEPILELTCHCTDGAWICDSSDGNC